MTDDGSDPGNAADAPARAPPIPLPPQTALYLESIASDAFKRSVDLDESVWRSLPFFSATLALTAAVIGHASSSVPRLSYQPFAAIAEATLVGAALVLAVSLRWFWHVIRPRRYEYPAPPHDIRLYAHELAAYHRELGASSLATDENTVEEVRVFLTDQYIDASESYFTHNEARVKARSFALLFMMGALVLAFACETLIFVDATLFGGATMRSEKVDVGTIHSAPTSGQADRRASSGAAQSIGHNARREPVRVPRSSGHSPQTLKGASPGPPSVGKASSQP